MTRDGVYTYEPLNRLSEWETAMKISGFLCLAILTIGSRAMAETASQPAGAGLAASEPAASRPAGLGVCSLRLAVSTDGLSFKDTGRVLLADAAAPDLVRLPNGRLLLVCDHVLRADGPALMVVAQSADDGQNWSEPQPTRMEGARMLPGRHGAMVLMPDGQLRLYYVAGGERQKKGKSRDAATQPFLQTVVLSALTRDGLHYRPDRSMGLGFDGTSDLHVTAARFGDRIHLFADDLTSPRAPRSDRAVTAAHLVSRDGQRFERVEPVGMRNACLVGGILAGETGLRAYLTGSDGIRSMVSTDGLAWKMEDGLRLAGGCDPAVIRRKDGSCLMVYCVRSAGKEGGLTAVTSEPADARGLGAVGESPGSGSPVGAVTFEPFAAESAGNTPLPSLDTPTGGAGQPAGQSSGSSSPTGQQLAGDPFPPKPDLSTPVDYREWVKQYYDPGQVDNNALDAYDTFMPDQRYPNQQRPSFPGEINDMFNSVYSGPIIPWEPSQYPDWEATHNSMQGLLEQFRQATRYERYVYPLDSLLGSEPTSDSVEPLYHVLLPSMAVHRAMTKATMADAWRAENGVVNPTRMIDAFETCLRNANHMEQGYTMIGHLVGYAEEALVERNALQALRHNVFASPAQMEAALDTLRQYDRSDARDVNWIPLEHASMLDVVQYLFPPGQDGQPRLNTDRATKTARDYILMSGSMPEEQLREAVQAKVDACARLNPEQLHQIVETIDSYFRQVREKWQTGYPQVRAKDIAELSDNARSENALLQDAIPSLSSAYHQTARNEASRRATQLTYEVHLFKARNGRWPSSLDELPTRPGSNSHTDPFTGAGFGYKLTESGPMIYTVGEDGQDNGGVHSEDTKTEGKDHIFWPPQK